MSRPSPVPLRTRLASASTLGLVLVGLMFAFVTDAFSADANATKAASAPRAEVGASPEAAPQPALAAATPERAGTSGETTCPAVVKQGSGPKAKAPQSFGEWMDRFAPILIILLVIGFVLARLPKVDLGHSRAFIRRRVLNWLPLGLTYAFLYMGRYNLTSAKVALGDLLTKGDFSLIFGVGAVVYGVAFVINGPLTDRFGGKKAMLVGALGTLSANFAMGLVTEDALDGLARGGSTQTLGAGLTSLLTILYAVNMYFQSFGAVAIVKVNAPWFHVRERGVFGAIFGILISLGVYFAYDWSDIILALAPVPWVFYVPAIILSVFVALDVFLVADSPSEAGLKDFDTGDASSGDDGPRLPVFEVFRRMLTNPVILTIAAIEFCSGYLRQAIMQYYKQFAKAIANPDPLVTWVQDNWGVLLCAAGILGGTVAGVISDRIFNSRRGPVSAVLYGLMLAGAVAGVFLVTTPVIGLLVVLMSLFIIGVHGMLSGTASMDFGGRKNAGVAVGIIDGFVYLGTGSMALLFGALLPSEKVDPVTCIRPDSDPANWVVWPLLMVPLALIGLLLSRRIWHAKPQPKGAGGAH
jgi:OPA family glycerol-3-phosphate transporter-like MFS transporter